MAVAAFAEEAEEAFAEEAEAFEEILGLEKCIKQFVLNAERNAKFLLSLQRENLFFARIVLEKRKDSDFLDAFKNKYFFYINFLLYKFLTT